jgi:hypothetical protein
MCNEFIRVKEELEHKGHSVDIPEGCKNPELIGRGTNSEKIEDKIKYDLIRKHFDTIKLNVAILVVNIEKNGVKGYIGGNTFLEMGFAHILNKKIFCLYPLPDLIYTSELIAMQPVILNGDLNLFG